MSLRARLAAALVVLLATGLAVAGAVTFTLLRSYLLTEVDTQLAAARAPVARALLLTITVPGPHGRGTSLLPTDTFGEFVAPSGVVVARGFLDPHGVRVAPPRLPTTYAAVPARGAAPIGTPFTVGATEPGGPSYRVLATTVVTDLGSGLLVVAIPLSQVTAILHRLLLVEIGIGVGGVVVLGVLGSGLVRVGLRPLDEIAETAGAIAAGDLSRRIPQADERTEVGRLARALNAMLAQIERAFDARAESEARLRRFVADASHELRTPLTSIRGWAELFRRGAASRPEDLEKAMRRIEEEATRMAGLVDDLLLLARLDQGRPLERTPVDLAAVATDAAADAQAVDPDRAVRVVAEAPLVVEGDEARLRQVAANLLANALAHTPPGTPVEVRVHAEDGPAGARVAVLEVADEGPGLTAEQQARVFERFYRGDPARGRGGAGLGLAIVAAIAAAHGGRATVRSEPGKGATFRVELPLERVELVPHQATRPPAGPAPDGAAVAGPPVAGPPVAGRPVAAPPGAAAASEDPAQPPPRSVGAGADQRSSNSR